MFLIQGSYKFIDRTNPESTWIVGSVPTSELADKWVKKLTAMRDIAIELFNQDFADGTLDIFYKVDPQATRAGRVPACLRWTVIQVKELPEIETFAGDQ